MSIWKQNINLDILKTLGKNTMIEHLGIEFTAVGDDFISATMPIDNRTIQPAGILHGGATCVLAETIGSVAANFCVDQKLYYCVGLDINTNHIRAIRNNFVTGIAKPFHIGKSTHVFGINVYDEHNQMIAVSRLTMAVLKR